jgi:hypothetical protein
MTVSAASMIDFSYTVDKPEYVQAQKLFINQRQKNATLIGVATIVMMLAGCGMLFYMTGGLMSAFAGCAALSVIMALIYFVSKPLTEKLVLGIRYRQEAVAMTDTHTVIDEEGVVTESRGLTSRRNSWREFTGWLEGKNVIVMMMGYKVRPIPKRVLSEPEQAELRNLLTEHIGPVNKLRRF